MSSIHKREYTKATGGKAISYYVKWRDAEGIQRSKGGFAFKHDAKDFAATIEMPDEPSIDNPKTFAEYYELWIQRLNVRVSTTRRHRFMYEQHIKDNFGEQLLTDIKRQDIQIWITGLRSKLSPSTILNVYGHFKYVLKDAVLDDELLLNPCDRIKAKRDLPKVTTKTVEILDRNEIKALAEAIDPRYYALVYLGCYAGLRIGELCSLRIRDIDFSRAELNIRSTIVEIGSKDTPAFDGEPKTEASKRTIDLPPPLVDILKAHIAKYRSNEQNIANPDKYVFTNSYGEQLKPHGFRSRPWKAAVSAIGKPDLTPHAMRHSGISLWAQSNIVDLPTIQSQAGHASAAFTISVYAKTAKDRQRMKSELGKQMVI